MNGIHAWSVLHDTAGMGIYIAVTSTGGDAWAVKQLALGDKEINELYGNAGVFSFVDAEHGWLLLAKQSSSAASFSALFTTKDGGQTWSRLRDPPVNGTIQFVSQQTGWLCGGVLGDELYVSRDSGLSWQRRTVKPPISKEKIFRTTFNLPVFQSSGEGTLAVEYEVSPPGSAWAGSALSAVSVMAIYQTSDAGNTWQLKSSSVGSVATRLTTVDSTVINAVARGGDTIVIGNGAAKHVAPLPAGLSSGRFDVDSLSFVDANIGWLLLSKNKGCVKPECAITSALLSTEDGGNTFTLLLQNTTLVPAR